MAKMTKEEIAARRKNMQERALHSIAKREQLNIRMDEELIMRLYSTAEGFKKPVGTLVREWVIERLNAGGKSGTELGVQQLLKEVSAMNKKIDKIEKSLNKTGTGTRKATQK